MKLSEKLYKLRKEKGLSQEQLAEKLKISRQAISKWESGNAVPEIENLTALSNFFSVSLDYLMKDDISELTENALISPPKLKKSAITYRLMGIIICIIGILCLIIWALILLLSPADSNAIGASSVITIDGNGIFLIISLTSVAFGSFLLLKSINKK